MTSGVSLSAALEAFILEHGYCGELDGGVEGDRVWMTCTCGAVINRSADPQPTSAVDCYIPAVPTGTRTKVGLLRVDLRLSW